MSMDMSLERVCYVQCNFCNTILVVNVPSSSNMLNHHVVTVRCGHCANLLSLNMGGLLHSAAYLQDFQQSMAEAAIKESASAGSSSTCNRSFAQHQQPPIRPPEKRQRVPSAYNRFIKEEIQRIKACNPKVTHREAFSAAAKNWAHLPNIHCGLNKTS